MNIKQLVSHACSFSVILAAAAVPGCNNEAPVGDLTVPFEIGAGIECSLKNVVDVKVTLLEIKSGEAEEEEVESTSVPCSEGKAIFNNIPVGTYQIRVEGFDPDEFVVVDNVPKIEDGVVEKLEVGEVLEGKETTTEIINLSSTPAKLWVRYELNMEGFQTMCSQIKMTELAISAFKNDGADQILTITLPCDATPNESNGYHYLSDPERELDGSVFDYVRVQPRDATGNMTGTDVKFALAMPPGAGRTVKLTFNAECTADKCDLQCIGGACTPD
ncbi:MAG TPA: hypothetical protein VGB85_07720 [Nannocystis sp.]|jgi:hypothetical protein